MNAMCTFKYLFVVYFSFAPVISASIHRYVNYFDIQVLIMVTETEMLTSTLHHNIFTYLDYIFSATFILSDFIHIYFYVYIYIYTSFNAIGWMVSNFISREVNVVLKIYKTLKWPHIEYCTQAWVPVWRHENWSVILKLECIPRRVTEIIKRVKDYSYRERLEKLALTILQERRLRSDAIETFQIINGIPNYVRHFFNISPLTENLLSTLISKTKSTNQFDFFVNRVIYFRNELPNQIKNSKSVKNFEINFYEKIW